MTVDNNSVVTIAYTLRNEEGTVIDSSDQNGNISYLHGHQNIVPGLETALAGKTVGDEINTEIEPTDGYGERRDDLVFSVPRERMPQDEELSTGMQFRAQVAEGQELVVTLVDVADDQVTLDGNHPLAGEKLVFDVKVEDVREATPEEIEHGHVHDATGAHHDH